jgi:2-polyprenyl-6-methoxyphenol hydroxylase-like FAD-dependent oxidoreductase
MNDMLDIAIIGAGLGGLTTALRLHQKGFSPKIYESTRELKPLGVGIAIQPYGMKEFTELGLLERIQAISVEAQESLYYNHFGQEIYGEKCGVYMGYPDEQRFLHRGLLQMLLYDVVKERLGDDAVVLGARCAGIDQDDDGVTIHFRPNDSGAPETVRADVVIAADGINSAVRQQLHPDASKPNYSGITLWRGTTLMEPYKTGGSILHIGAPTRGSMIVYPLFDDYEGTGLTLTNWVVEEMGRSETIEDWTQEGDISEIEHMFDDVDLPFVDVSRMLREAQETYLFPLIDHDPLESWSDGRILLIGDAAHAMYPRGGNGACQSFVDSRVIAEKLVEFADPVEAFKAFEAQRIAFVNRIVMANRGDGPEVVRRLVEERTGGLPFDDIEAVLPFKEADAIFNEYHKLAGMGRPEHSDEPSGFRSVFFEAEEAT